MALLSCSMNLGKVLRFGVGFFVVVLVLASLIITRVQIENDYQNNGILAQTELTNTPTLIPTETVTPTATLTPTFTVTPSPIPASKILFGIGSQAGPAMDFRIVKEAPVHMLTSWYNGTKDLEWMRVQQNDLIPRLYAKKYVVHLITWTDLPEENITTPHGPACGRPYPVSTQVVEDMKQLAAIYKGNATMYVTLFTEFQTFTCTDNNWIGNENYYNTLKDNYRKIKDNFHAINPQAKVAISWGGWSSRYDDKVNQGGRSLFAHFADVMKESDFTAFQTMESDTNVAEIRDMTRILGGYKRPVMLAHYKPSNHSHAVFDNDMRELFTDSIMQELIKNGLFAFSFMDNEMFESSETSY
jgi:hypothetical protein